MSSSLKSRRKDVGELQLGTRPSHELMIRNETRRIQKPERKPVIIYMVSPKIIHVEASEFMALVQRLTGPESSATDQSSPAAGTRRFPVRVKARVLTTHSGGSESGAISTYQNLHPSLSSVLPVSPMHDYSSPPSSFANGIGAQKEGSLAASQSWLLRGDYSSLPSGYVLGSPNYLDIYHHHE